MKKNKSNSISLAVFLIGCAFLLFFNVYWPYILIVIGTPISLRDFLEKRVKDGLVALFVFFGFFVFAQFNVSWQILVPILFVMSAIYILCREWIKDQMG